MNSHKQLGLAIKYIDTIKAVYGDNLQELSEHLNSVYAQELVKILTTKPETQKIEPFITIYQYQEEKNLELDKKQIMLIDKLCQIVAKRDGIPIEKRVELYGAYPKQVFDEVLADAQQIYSEIYIETKNVNSSYMTIYQYIEEEGLDFDKQAIMLFNDLCQVACERDGIPVYTKQVFDKVFAAAKQAYIETDINNQDDDFTMEDLSRRVNNLL